MIEEAVTEYYRIMKPGAYAVHIIDLRDHLHVRGDHQVEGDWLEALRFPEWLHNAQISNRRGYINRLRARGWKSVFESAGFRCEQWRLRHEQLPAGFDARQLHKSFHSADEDFSVSWIDALLQKPVTI
jgi:hypothetical protein